MLIIDALNSANSEYVVFFLLSAYLEAEQFVSKLPQFVTRLPLGGSDDVEARLRELMRAASRPTGRGEDAWHLEIWEALDVFRAASRRLLNLKRDPSAAKVGVLSSGSSGARLRDLGSPVDIAAGMGETVV